MKVSECTEKNTKKGHRCKQKLDTFHDPYAEIVQYFVFL